MKKTFGQRLAEERQRLELSQNEFSGKVGASKRSQIDWESDAASPKADYVMKFGEVGVDVYYLLVGERSKPIEDTLNAREKALLNNYKNSGKEGQRSIERLAMLEAQQPNLKPKESDKKAA